MIMARHKQLVIFLFLAASSADEVCEDVCAGLTADTPMTREILEEQWGCRCERRSLQQQVTEHNATMGDCIGGECSGRCNGFEGAPTCDSFASLGIKCRELENDWLFYDNSPRCNCNGAACPVEDKVFDPAVALCDQYERIEVATAAQFSAVQHMCTTLVVVGNIELSEPIVVPHGGETRLEGSTSTLNATISSRGLHRVLTVEPSAWVELASLRLQGGFDSVLGGCVVVGAFAKVVAEDVVISGCSAGFYGGGVMLLTSSVFIMRRSVISNATAEIGGGCYLFTSSTLELFDGSVIDLCLAEDAGGGISVGRSALAVLDDGSEIRRSFALYVGGGGVVAAYYGTFKLLGGSAIVDSAAVSGHGSGGCVMALIDSYIVVDGSALRRCSAMTRGGGIFSGYDSSVLLQSGAVLEDMSAEVNGGCIGAAEGLNGFVRLVGASLVRCFAWSSEGGAVRILSTPLEVTDTLIQDTWCGDRGSCVAVSGPVTAYITRSRLVGCSCDFGSCGVYVRDSVALDVSDTVLVEEAPSSSAGGLAVMANAIASLHRVHISGASTPYNGAGVLVGSGAIIHLDSSIIENCTAGASGGGLALENGGVAHVTGQGVFRKNTAALGNGGAISVTDDARLYASGSCWFVPIALDWTSTDATGFSSALSWLEKKNQRASKEEEEEEEEEALLFDDRGQFTHISPTAGEVTNKAFCLKGGAYEFWIASFKGLSWEGATWDFPDLAPGISSFVTTMETLEVREVAGVAAEFFVAAGDDNKGTRLRFEENAALGGVGGAIALHSTLAAYVRDAEFVANLAGEGGAVSIGLLGILEMEACELRSNWALAGGAVISGQLSSTTLEDVRAVANSAIYDGGFALFDRVLASSIANATIERNVAAARGGGLAYDGCDAERSTLSSSRFRGNVASEIGGAVWASDGSFLDVASCDFVENQALGSGGGGVTVAHGVEFVDPRSCTQVVISLDWRSTTERCEVFKINIQSEWDNWSDLFCDSDEGMCDVARADSDAKCVECRETACLGCQCVQASSLSASGAENYLQLRSLASDPSSSSSSSVIYATPGARSWRLDTHCLPPGDYAVSLHSNRGIGWFGGTARVFTKQRVIADSFAFLRDDNGYGFVTNEEVFNIPSGPDVSNFLKNVAPNGGGGAIHLAGDADPPGMVLLARGSSNRARYGNWVGGPPVRMALKNPSSTNVWVASGQVLEEPIVVELYDDSGNVVNQNLGSVSAVIRSSEENATFVNAIAEFIDGRATFRTTIATYRPDTILDAYVEASEISTLEDKRIAIRFHFRACFNNEFENDAGICSICERGKYLLPAKECSSGCARGFACEDDGQSLETLKTRRGFWRPTTLTTRPSRCPKPGACPTTTEVGDDACPPGFVGPLCASCAMQHFENFKRKCQRCQKAQTASWAIASAAAISFAALLAWLTCTRRGFGYLAGVVLAAGATGTNPAVTYVREVQNNRHKNDDEDETSSWFVKVVIKCKMLLSMLQILANMSDVFVGLRFPSAYAGALRVTTYLTSFDALVRARCVSSTTATGFYVQGLVATSTTPVAFAALFLVVGLIKSKWHPERADQHRNVFYEVTLLVFHFALASTSTAAFRAFVCDVYGDDDRSFLRAAPTIRCTSALWRTFIAPFAALNIVVYPVGTCVLYAVLLFTHRDVINPHHHRHDVELPGVRQSTRQLMSRSLRKVVEASYTHQRELDTVRRSEIEEKHSAVLSFRFLYVDYQCRTYYYELVESSRRIVLTAVIAVILPGSAMQVNVGYVVAVIYAFFCTLIKPFASREDNILAPVTQMSTAAALYITSLLKVEALDHNLAAIFLLLTFFVPLFAFFWALSPIFCPSLIGRFRRRRRRSSISSAQPLHDFDKTSCAHVARDSPRRRSRAGIPSPALSLQVEDIVNHSTTTTTTTTTCPDSPNSKDDQKNVPPSFDDAAPTSMSPVEIHLSVAASASDLGSDRAS